MKAKRPAARKQDKGRVRSLVRRGTRADKSPAVAKRTRRLRGPTMCERCGAVYRDKRWQRGTREERSWPVGLAWTVCPACRQLETGEYFGRVMIVGAGALRDEDAIRRRIEHVAKRAQFTQPERRVLSVERRGSEIEVLTTSQKLAHRIASALVSAFGGKASFNWSDRDGELRAVWHWEGRSGGH